MFIIYIIFEKDFEDTLYLQAFDKNNVEIGRLTQEVKGKKGNATYSRFRFNDMTDITSKSRIIIK